MCDFDVAWETYDLAGVPGFMHRHEMRWLYETARTIREGIVVELGVMHGRSSCAIAAGLADAESAARFIGIDLFTGGSSAVEGTVDADERMAAVREAFATRGLPEPELVRGHTQDAVVLGRVADGSVAWLFLDADHGYAPTLRSLRLWLPKVRPGGLMSGHDIDRATVRLAVSDECPKWAHAPGSLWTTEVDNVPS